MQYHEKPDVKEISEAQFDAVCRISRIHRYLVDGRGHENCAAAIARNQAIGIMNNARREVLRDHLCPTCGGPCRCDVPRKYCVHCA